MAGKLRIDVWADLVCPFCWIGKRRLEEALAREGLADEVEVVHRAFRLDPSQRESRPLGEYLARRFGGPEGARRMVAHVEAMGAEAGLRFDFARAVSAPTLDAHRVVQHAQAHGAGDAVVERLMRAHFLEGEDLGDRDTLRRLGAEAGLDEAALAALLASDAHVDAVERDQAQAHALGARGVPFFVFDGRVGVSGAQPVDVFVEALRRARA